MFNRKLFRILAILLVFALFLAACGGDSTDSTPPPPPTHTPRGKSIAETGGKKTTGTEV
jgi:hypothetical protein